MSRLSCIPMLLAACAAGCVSTHEFERATDTTRAMSATADKLIDDRLKTVEQTLRDEKTVRDSEKATHAAQTANIERYSTLAFGVLGTAIAAIGLGLAFRKKT